MSWWGSCSGRGERTRPFRDSANLMRAALPDARVVDRHVTWLANLREDRNQVVHSIQVINLAEPDVTKWWHPKSDVEGTWDLSTMRQFAHALIRATNETFALGEAVGRALDHYVEDD